MKNLITAIIGIVLLAWMFSLCSSATKNKTGHEYMPDMVHSVAYEPNQFEAYHWNHWDNNSTFHKSELAQPRHKVEGTIPRGATGEMYASASNYSGGVRVPINSSAPFYYGNTEEERLRCEKEMVKNPFPITKAGLDRAKPVYNIYCGVCHGEKGDGQGILVTVPDAKYPAAPKNFLADDMLNAGNGRYYFAIMHGKNVMGSYSDKLSYEERWQVIHYIRSLQAKTAGATYSETANTLNNFDMPAAGVASGPVRTPQTTAAPVAPPPAGK